MGQRGFDEAGMSREGEAPNEWYERRLREIEARKPGEFSTGPDLERWDGNSPLLTHLYDEPSTRPVVLAECGCRVGVTAKGNRMVAHGKGCAWSS